MFVVKAEEQYSSSALFVRTAGRGYGLASKVKSRAQMRRLIILSSADWLPHYHGSSRVYLGLLAGAG